MLIAMGVVAPTASGAAIATGTAPGCCGSGPVWPPGGKTSLGRTEAPASTGDDVWFTGANGILTELFYPNLDTPDLTDQQFIVGDSRHTWDQTEQAGATHSVATANANALAWTGDQHRRQWQMADQRGFKPTRRARWPTSM